MVDMGAEVGLKMRSAIKAKLTELDCYVDDELPDYIMVMVANKRTKSQMNEDLSLFLNTKTSDFVEWLHIVLKKLKEVTVTNLDVYKKAAKRKSSELSKYAKVKKEKRMKQEKLVKSECDTVVKHEDEETKDKCLTDDLPLNVKSFSENRKIVLTDQVANVNVSSVSEMNQSDVNELDEIEKQIRSVKSRLGLKIDEEVEEDELRKLIRANSEKNSEENGEDENSETTGQMSSMVCNGRHVEMDTSRRVSIPLAQSSEETERNKDNADTGESRKKKEHTRIVFSRNDFESPKSPTKKSILERLGKYGEDKDFRNGNSDSSREKKERTKFEIRSKREKDKYDSKGESSRSEKANENYRSRDEGRLRRELLEKYGSKSGKERLSVKQQDDLRKNLSRDRCSADSLKKDLKKRLGISSKVTIPQMDEQLLENTFKKREVVSVVKVKPRVLPPNVQQANKNLLLKAVADAQKSMAQAKSVGQNMKNDENVTKSDPENSPESSSRSTLHRRDKNVESRRFNRKTIAVKEKEELRKILTNNRKINARNIDAWEEKDEQAYVPKPIRRSSSTVEYVPSSKEPTENNVHETAKKQTFIVTLDGIEQNVVTNKISVKERLYGRRTPSPITFEDAGDAAVQRSASSYVDFVTPKVSVSTTARIPDELPIVATPVMKKVNNEKCKYFPLCRNGDKCEFFHPNKSCEQFPYCKFGENCLYIHPICKFGTSCTRRDCPYTHTGQSASKSVISVVPAKQIQTTPICKYFPSCINLSCPFLHPKPCKFGKYCKNQGHCNFLHSTPPSKAGFTWRSK